MEAVDVGAVERVVLWGERQRLALLERHDHIPFIIWDRSLSSNGSIVMACQSITITLNKHNATSNI